MRRGLLIALGVIVLLPLLALGGFLLFFDADSLRPRLTEAVTHATGREFRIEGPLTLKPALVPTLTAEGLVLANVPGGSAPEMLRLRRASVRLALLPLITGRVQIASLDLEGGTLLLENGNWRFTRPDAAPDPNARPADPASTDASDPMTLDIRSVTLRDWRITAGGEQIQLPRARLTGHGPGQPLDLTATLIARGAEALIEGRGTPDGGRLTAALPGARVTLDAAREEANWRGTLAAELPQLAALNRLAGRELPALTGLTLRAAGGWVNAAPILESLEARATGGTVMGATLSGAQITMAAQDGPAKLEASGRFRDQPIALTGEVTPMALQAGTPTPVALRLQAADMLATAVGTWPGTVKIEARAPDLSALTGLLATPLPPLRNLVFNADVAARGDAAVGIPVFGLTSSGGDLYGSLEAGWSPRPMLRGTLGAKRLDLDAFRPPAQAAAQLGAPAQAAPAAAPSQDRLIPDVSLDLTPLRAFDADLTFEFAELHQGSTTLRQVSGHLVNEAGKAQLNPFTATLPAGRLALRAAADANAAPPALQVAGGGQGINLALLAPGGPLRGRADLDMDLRGQGGSTRALAATATGHLGLAVTEGQLTGGWAQAAGRLIPGAGDSIPLSCGAMRWDLDRGNARTRIFFLEGAPGRAAGEGTINLRDESIAARLSVDLRVAGVRVRAPIPVTGTLLAPRLETQGLVQGALSGDLGEQLERALPGLGALLPPQGAGGPAMPGCAGALRIARGGRDGPVPTTPAPAAQQPPRNAVPPLEDLLRGILR